MEERGWDKTYWFIDLHSTVVVPNYAEEGIPTEFYPMAKEVLQILSNRSDICLIMYTCSHPKEIKQYLEFFDGNDIHFEYVNENPEVKTGDDAYGCYDDKPYMNVLFEDKAGFHPEEWFGIKELLETKYKE
jgi:hypothetical protein